MTEYNVPNHLYLPTEIVDIIIQYADYQKKHKQRFLGVLEDIDSIGSLFAIGSSIDYYHNDNDGDDNDIIDIDNDIIDIDNDIDHHNYNVNYFSNITPCVVYDCWGPGWPGKSHGIFPEDIINDESDEDISLGLNVMASLSLLNN